MSCGDANEFTLADPSTFPSHLARVISRVNQTNFQSPSELFLYTSYAVECMIKTIVVSICAGLRSSSPDTHYRFEYELVHADGLGVWEKIIMRSLTQSYQGYIDKELRPLIEWLSQTRTRAEDQWVRDVDAHCKEVLNELGFPVVGGGGKISVKMLYGPFVNIRNKTKAHGAPGDKYFAEINPPYLNATRLLLLNCPVFTWEWLYLAQRRNKSGVKALRLKGDSPVHLSQEQSRGFKSDLLDGIYFRLPNSERLFYCGDMLQTDWECSEFLLPNGAMDTKGSAEFLDYSSGKQKRYNVSRLTTPPAPLPPSATEGNSDIDVYNNVFGNIPDLPDGYVERPKLQKEIEDRLMDKNHPIITLHGLGGIGKTSLALYMAHKLSKSDDPLYEYIVWLSARDLELKPSSVSEVRRAIPSLEDACKLMAKFLGIEPSLDAFAQFLQAGSNDSKCGTLFVFDNFETLDNPRETFNFLTLHTHIPNKVLITSRERTFKGDFPIEIGGMEYPETRELILRESEHLNIQGLIDENEISRIFGFSSGHPYMIRVVLGEMAHSKVRVQLSSLPSRRRDILGALFERSFNRLSTDGKWVFFCVAIRQSVTTDLALWVVLGERDIDVESGIEECLSFSFINRRQLSDEEYCYLSPGFARNFAKKKLEGDPDKLAINECRGLLEYFGVVKEEGLDTANVHKLVKGLFAKCRERARAEACTIPDTDVLVTRVAELWPDAWFDVAKFRRDFSLGDDSIAYALRRATEERPQDKEPWLARANHASEMSDGDTQVVCLLSAVEVDPKDVELVSNAAHDICKYIIDRKSDLPLVRRGVYLENIRSRMVQLADNLDATGFSRLAWLFLLEGNEKTAREYAIRGLKRDSSNAHCLKILEKLP